ncbi:MAG: hypothetical protein II419_02620, partial [Acidaminococcaceae bacterium]|nr:hypothetical protein [Acidaminococcaceae bacterium]
SAAEYQPPACVPLLLSFEAILNMEIQPALIWIDRGVVSIRKPPITLRGHPITLRKQGIALRKPPITLREHR